MAALTGTTPAASYGDLLHMSHSGLGVDATARQVHDGLGNTTVLYVSSTKLIIQGSTAGVLTVGPNGATNPTLHVDPSAAICATGISVVGAAAGSGVLVVASSSGSNESLVLSSKGSGRVYVTGSSGAGTGTLEFVPGLTGNYITYGGAFSAFVFANANAGSSLSSSLTRVGVARDAVLGWSGTNNSADSAIDTGLKRVAANVVGLESGDWLQLTPGRTRLTANVTNATATMSNLTDLSVTLIAGRKYQFTIILFVADDVAADGIKVDLDGGTATVTSLRAHASITDTALLASTQVTALATDVTASTVTGDAIIVIRGALVCNAAGTLVPRFAQNLHTSGTATVYLNSYLMIDDIAN